jgi:hypothetical protein
MNQQQRILKHLARCGRTSCAACEQLLCIRSVTARVAEINKRHKRERGCALISAFTCWGLNAKGEPHRVTYYDINAAAKQRDLFGF